VAGGGACASEPVDENFNPFDEPVIQVKKPENPVENPSEDSDGDPADLWKIHVKSRKWVRDLIRVGAKIGGNNWPAWWGFLKDLHGATVEDPRHQTLVDFIRERFIPTGKPIWPQDVRELWVKKYPPVTPGSIVVSLD
jgi:hypothetical protein